jgi:hypothetical protein
MSGTLFIIDIDGTIAHAGRRFKEAGPEPSRDDKAVYDVWVRNVQNIKSLQEDQPIAGMAELVNSLHRATAFELGINIVYLTSREEKWRNVTEKWLEHNSYPLHKSYPLVPLVMREDGDYKDSANFKESIIKFLSSLYKSTNVVVLDDDEHGTIEEKCHKNGWTMLKARSGGQR